MQLQLGATNVTLQDGLGTWNGSAANALALWNQHLKRSRFGWINNSTAPIGAHNGKNNVVFASSVYGEGFGGDTLAVTVWWTTGGTVTTEADVLFNNAFHFNSYRGPLHSNVYDFHRVALHEFGHVLGLNHPDQIGQTVPAIMNSVISDLDSLTANDIAGAEFLYGYHITSSWSLNIIRGDLLSYQINADNNPTSFDATGLPPGLVINRSTGRIAGRPTTAAIYRGTVTAHSSLGDATANMTIEVRQPRITSADSLYELQVGDEVSFQVVAEGHPSSYQAVSLPPGLRINPQTGLITGILTLSGTYYSGLTANSPIAGAVTGQMSFHINPSQREMLKRFGLSVKALLADPARNRVYAAATSEPSLAAIETRNLTLFRTIPLANEPTAMCFSPDARELFVACNGVTTPLIEVIDLNTLTRVRDLPVPFAVRDMKMGLNGRLFLSALSYDASQVMAQIDSATGAELAAFPPGLHPGQLEISPDRHTLYLGEDSFPYASIWAFDVNGNVPAVRERAIVPGPFAGFTLSHDGRFLGVAVHSRRTVLKLSGNDVRQSLGEFTLPASQFVGGAIAFSRLDEKVFVTTGSTFFGIDVFNTANLAYSRTIDPGYFGPSEMVVDNSGKFLFGSDSPWSHLEIFPTGLGSDSVTPLAKSLLNVSTRLKTQPGENVLIAGFVIAGSEPKKIMIRARGPSLPVTGKLSDPVVELRGSSGTLLATNDNWNSNRASTILTGLAPIDEHEASIIATLASGSYTTIVRGAQAASGIAIAEVFDLTPDSNSKLKNISTRGKVETGDNVMIGGFVIGGNEPTKVLIRAIGPSLSRYGIQGALQDPVLELHGSNGSLIFQNDDWRSHQQADISGTHLPPADNRESAIVATLRPGGYTAIVRGKNSTTGVALVEVYNLETN